MRGVQQTRAALLHARAPPDLMKRLTNNSPLGAFMAGSVVHARLRGMSCCSASDS